MPLEAAPYVHHFPLLLQHLKHLTPGTESSVHSASVVALERRPGVFCTDSIVQPVCCLANVHHGGCQQTAPTAFRKAVYEGFFDDIAQFAACGLLSH